jgi:HEAT repeat protein
MGEGIAFWSSPGFGHSESSYVALPVLRDALRNTNAHVRVQAARALWQMSEDKEKVIEVLTQVLKRKDGIERFLAAAALGEIGPDARPAVPALIDMLGAWDDFSQTVAKALKKIDPTAAAAAGVP